MAYPIPKSYTDREALNIIARAFGGNYQTLVANGGTFVSESFYYSSYNDSLAMSLVVSSVSGTTPSIAINVSPVDPDDNEITSDVVLTLSETAVGNYHIEATGLAYRRYKVDITVVATVVGELTIYG